MKYLLHIALILSIITYSFWEYFPKGSFYIGNSLFIFMLCVYIYATNKNSFIKFVLLFLGLNNLLDELFFDNTELGLNELIVTIIIIIIAIIKRYKWISTQQ